MSIQAEVNRIVNTVALQKGILDETAQALGAKAGGMGTPIQANTEALAAILAAVEALPDNGVTPQKYGAVGDGVTDDTEAFQQALAENRVVSVPGGEYLLLGTLVIRENCALRLAQNTVLKFTQLSGNCIEMRGSATLHGNHAIISVPYSFTGNAISLDTTLDGTDHATSIPPYTKSSPMFKRQRFVYDVNIIKPMDNYGKIGFCRSADGACNGTAIYISATNVSNSTIDIPWMWAITMSGIRIAGGFSYGIHAINYDSAEGSTGHYTDDAWNHDMRIEAVVEGCEVGVALENCSGAHLAVTIQPGTAQNNGAKYAKWGVYLNDSRFVDMIGSRVWDWNANVTLWTADGMYQHLALIGNCRGLLLDDFIVHEEGGDIKDRIYTDTESNFDTITILQEPGNKWFKSVDNAPYFNNGTKNVAIRLKTDKFTAEDTYFIQAADGEYIYTPKYTNLVPTSIDTDGAAYNGNGYLLHAGLNGVGVTDNGITGNMVTGYIPINGPYHTYRIAGTGITFDRYGCNICFYDSSFNFLKTIPYGHIGDGPASDGICYWGKLTEEEETLITYTAAKDMSAGIWVTGIEDAAYVRVSVAGQDTSLIVTVDEKVEMDAKWQGEPQRLDESIYAQNVFLASPSGNGFRLVVDDNGNLSTSPLEIE